MWSPFGGFKSFKTHQGLPSAAKQIISWRRQLLWWNIEPKNPDFFYQHKNKNVLALDRNWTKVSTESRTLDFYVFVFAVGSFSGSMVRTQVSRHFLVSRQCTLHRKPHAICTCGEKVKEIAKDALPEMRAYVGCLMDKLSTFADRLHHIPSFPRQFEGIYAYIVAKPICPAECFHWQPHKADGWTEKISIKKKSQVLAINSWTRFHMV